MALLLLVVLTPAGTVADLDAGLERGWELLDSGSNAEAEAHFRSLLALRQAGCAAARGVAEARRRACLPPLEVAPG
ncbi:MAG: hypothetical protein IH621_11780, partial [Krumholzibacteria bacterium]|nr:hypothetical protein [Candidatus Krumholzibacteria bacterium]